MGVAGEFNTLQLRPVRSVRRHFAEFLGTFIFTIVIGSTLQDPHVFTAVAAGAALTVALYVFGPISGGHFNPAVSLVMMGVKEDIGIQTSSTTHHPIWSSFFYICSQLWAGWIGGWCVWALHNSRSQSALLPPQHTDTPQNLARIGVVEFAYTFMLVFVILNVFGTKCESFGIAIGFVVIAAVSAVGFISGAALNPAVALGMFGFTKPIWLFYAGCECVGALVARVVFSFLRNVQPWTRSEHLQREYDLDLPENPLTPREEPVERLTEKVLCEFFGTFFIVLSCGLSAVSKRHTESSSALSAAATLISFHYSLRDISGGHYNPAATIAVYISQFGQRDDDKRLFSATAAIYYILTQLSAGIIAGLVCLCITDHTVDMYPHFKADEKYMSREMHLLCTECSRKYKYYTEFNQTRLKISLFTAVFTFVFLVVSVSASSRLQDFQSFVVGIAFLVGGVAATCGHLNPAISIGLDMAHALKHSHFRDSLLLAGAQFLGAVIAAIFFHALHITTSILGSGFDLLNASAEYIYNFFLGEEDLEIPDEKKVLHREHTLRSDEVDEIPEEKKVLHRQKSLEL